MYNNEKEIIKYIMDAIDEGVSIEEIRKEITLLTDGGGLHPTEQMRERALPEGGHYETL